MDQFDRATLLEERERESALAAARSVAARDYESELCIGCSYATETNFGKRCDAWVECLQDLVKRERAGR